MSSYIPDTQKYAANDFRQIAITEALVSCVAGDSFPLSVGETAKQIFAEPYGKGKS